MSQPLLVTTALPYANGPIHLGHLVEHIQADIWVRCQRMRGRKCYFICADDAHGTPIMLRAQQQGISPEQLIERVHKAHTKDFKDFYIEFDNYSSTHSPENKALSIELYNRLKKRGDIVTRTINQAFDAEENIFLPDRYVKGTCPHCNTPDQYGDNCESCGATYDPLDLIDPVSVLSGTTPIEKSSEHYFFRLERHESMLHQWMNAHQGTLQPAVQNKLNEWFKIGLAQWDISRDAPYFGFTIPGTTNKYFYVWMDAPIGYMASFKQLCKRTPHLNFEAFWNKNSQTELYHFIGKDIIYFHALFWPAMLEASNFRTPTAVYAHGFLTINGKKMSKSRGTFITARQYLDTLNPEYLRYYFAAKLGNGIDDIDLNVKDFAQRVNADLVGKVVNIASRCARFIEKQFDNQLSDSLTRPDLFKHFVTTGETIIERFIERDYNQAIRLIMALADEANQYIDEVKPWVVAKQEGQAHVVQATCTMGLNLFRLLIFYLTPVLPDMAKQSAEFLNSSFETFEARKTPLLAHSINAFKPLMQRVNPSAFETWSDHVSSAEGGETP